MSVLNNFNPKVMKHRWQQIKANPYASAKLQYMTTKWLAIFLMAIIGYQFLNLIFTFKGGGEAGGMANLTRAFMVLVGIIILSKIWTAVVIPARRTLKHYESLPVKVENEEVNVEKEVDEIFDHFKKKETQK